LLWDQREKTMKECFENLCETCGKHGILHFLAIEVHLLLCEQRE
jgi:hypothetical protein